MSFILSNSNFYSGLLLSVTEIFGDYGAKMQNPVLTFASYNALAWELLEMMKYQSLTMVNANWDGISNVLTMIVGFLLGERFNTQEYIGLAMITTGLFLINKR